MAIKLTAILNAANVSKTEVVELTSNSRLVVERFDSQQHGMMPVVCLQVLEGTSWVEVVTFGMTLDKFSRSNGFSNETFMRNLMAALPSVFGPTNKAVNTKGL